MGQGLKRYKSLLALAVALLFAHSAAFALHATNPHRTTSAKSHRKTSSSSARALEPDVPRRRTIRCLRQNEEIDRLDLPRIQDDDELEALKAVQCTGPDSRKRNAED